MKLAKILAAAFVCFLMFGSISAQSPQRRPAGRPAARPPAPASSPTPKPDPPPVATPSAPKQPVQLAIVNGQPITTADIDPRVREEVEGLEDRIAEARSKILALQINTVLLDVEAKKRKVTSQQLYDSEVTKRVTDPTEAEIKAFIDPNQDQIDTSDPVKIRPEIIATLRGLREQQLSEAFVQRMRSTSPVVMGVDINAPNLSRDAVVATVAGRAITAGIINERFKSIAYKLQRNSYEAEREALDHTINVLLLIAEANRRSVPPEDIVRAEVTDKIHHPTDAEIAKFYAENKASISGDLDSVRAQLASYLEEQEQGRLDRAMSERLRKGVDLRVLISQPEPPIQLIRTDGEPFRGDLNARVTVVEFTDFECPACAAMHPVLEEVLKSYASKVCFVVRNFPLARHAHARRAAEAADAANAQGKFFEYTALLFKRQKALDVPSLKRYATELGLDRIRFDAAIEAGTYAAEVRHDMDDGEMYGVESTPTIFINGVMLGNLSAEGLRAAIDSALAKSNP